MGQVTLFEGFTANLIAVIRLFCNPIISVHL